MIYSTQVNAYRGHFEWQESICQKKPRKKHTHIISPSHPMSF